MTAETGRWVPPEEQIEFLKSPIGYLRELPSINRQIETLHTGERLLAEMDAKHARGELEPIWTDENGPF